MSRIDKNSCMSLQKFNTIVIEKETYFSTFLFFNIGKGEMESFLKDNDFSFDVLAIRTKLNNERKKFDIIRKGRLKF